MIRRQVIGAGIILGILVGILIDTWMLEHPSKIVYAREPEQPQVIQIETFIVWTPELIERTIRDTFVEQPNVAVAIAKCESGLVSDIQSKNTLSYGQERSFGIFQIHEPDWKDTAIALDLVNWRTDPQENIKLARHIYDVSGKSFKPWSCLKLI